MNRRDWICVGAAAAFGSLAACIPELAARFLACAFLALVGGHAVELLLVSHEQRQKRRNSGEHCDGRRNV